MRAAILIVTVVLPLLNARLVVAVVVVVCCHTRESVFRFAVLLLQWSDARTLCAPQLRVVVPHHFWCVLRKGFLKHRHSLIRHRR